GGGGDRLGGGGDDVHGRGGQRVDVDAGAGGDDLVGPGRFNREPTRRGGVEIDQSPGVDGLRARGGHVDRGGVRRGGGDARERRVDVLRSGGRVDRDAGARVGRGQVDQVVRGDGLETGVGLDEHRGRGLRVNGDVRASRDGLRTSRVLHGDVGSVGGDGNRAGGRGDVLLTGGGHGDRRGVIRIQGDVTGGRGDRLHVGSRVNRDGRGVSDQVDQTGGRERLRSGVGLHKDVRSGRRIRGDVRAGRDGLRTGRVLHGDVGSVGGDGNRAGSRGDVLGGRGEHVHGGTGEGVDGEVGAGGD